MQEVNGLLEELHGELLVDVSHGQQDQSGVVWALVALLGQLIVEGHLNLR